MANLPVARLIGHVDGQTVDEIIRNLATQTIGDVIHHLTTVPDPTTATDSLGAGDVAVTGTFDEVNRIFYSQRWSDGLPIVPPTESRVDEFLAFSPDEPRRVLGALAPSGSAATIHNVAVNGVMANCRPEYMPILVAIAEILAAPEYGVEHSGDTTGGDALIILSGPLGRELGFNCEEAALRDGYQANTSVGRFLRLYLRNVARSLPGGGDKSTFGHTWRVVLAEHELAAHALGWPLFSVDQGFEAGDDVVTIARFTSGGGIGSIFGNDPDSIVQYLADGLVRHSSWELVFTAGFAPGTYRPLLVISPMVASTLTRAKWPKHVLRQRLFEHARLPASKFERYIGAWTNLVPGRPSLSELVRDGTASAVFSQSEDPHRLVPIVDKPDDILLVVSGDPLRSNAYAFGSNGMHGFPTSRRVRKR